MNLTSYFLKRRTLQLATFVSSQDMACIYVKDMVGDIPDDIDLQVSPGNFGGLFVCLWSASCSFLVY